MGKGEALASQRELITKREINITPGGDFTDIRTISGGGNYQSSISGGGNYQSSGQSKVVAMRIEAEVPRVTVGGGYQSQQNVNIGYQTSKAIIMNRALS